MASSQLGARDDVLGTRACQRYLPTKLTGDKCLSTARRKTLLQVRTSYRHTSLYLIGSLTQVVIGDSWY